MISKVVYKYIFIKDIYIYIISNKLKHLIKIKKKFFNLIINDKFIIKNAKKYIN